MTIALVINGVTFAYPEQDNESWGPSATDWASAVTSGMLQKAGGLFTLLSETDFGASYGLKSLYYKSRTANISDSGQIRLAVSDVISWRNNANGANLALGVNGSDELTFNGSAIQPILTIGDLSDVGTDGITITGGTGSVIGSGTTISQHVADASHNGYLSSVDWSIFNAKQASGNYITALTGDVTASGPGSVAATIAANAVTNAKLATMAAHSFKGNNTGSTGNALDLTATQLTAELNVMVGDSGSGGTKGLVPAPGVGDSAKYLRGDGTFATPAGAGDVVGPSSATANAVALFNGTTGKIIKDGGVGTTSQVFVGGTTPAFGNVPVNALPAYTPGTKGAVPSTGLPGITSGASVGTGVIGETLISSVTSAVSSPSAGTFTNVTSVAVTAGVWLAFGVNQMTRVSGQATFETAMSANSGNTTTDHVKSQNYDFITNTTINDISQSVGPWLVNISSPATYYLKFKYDAGTQNTGNVQGTLTFLRIA